MPRRCEEKASQVRARNNWQTLTTGGCRSRGPAPSQLRPTQKWQPTYGMLAQLRHEGLATAASTKSSLSFNFSSDLHSSCQASHSSSFKLPSCSFFLLSSTLILIPHSSHFPCNDNRSTLPKASKYPTI